MVYSQADMPYTESGVVPDIIMNPHSIPSRMTVGMCIEILTAKLCAAQGFVTDGTMFNSVDIDAISGELEKMGFDKSGEEVMYSGLTGEPMQAKIFIGPCYYQRLQKFVADAMYAVSSGPKCALTRQPIGGKAAQGGLRLGEMERDVCIANGTVAFLQEKFFDHSDGFNIYICQTCGSSETVVVNEKAGIYKCSECRDMANIIKVPSSWCTNLMIKEARAMNIGMRWSVQPPEFTAPKPLRDPETRSSKSSGKASKLRIEAP
jgi:DNA-directed RNA polymerase II subunit RPB2